MNIKKTIFLVALSGVLFTSCNNNNNIDLPKGDYENGILIANEGAFSGGTGTLDYISDDYLTEESSIYSNVNGENIGTVLQSIGFNGDTAIFPKFLDQSSSINDKVTPSWPLNKVSHIITEAIKTPDANKNILEF